VADIKPGSAVHSFLCVIRIIAINVFFLATLNSLSYLKNGQLRMELNFKISSRQLGMLVELVYWLWTATKSKVSTFFFLQTNFSVINNLELVPGRNRAVTCVALSKFIWNRRLWETVWSGRLFPCWAPIFFKYFPSRSVITYKYNVSVNKQHFILYTIK